MSGESKQFHWAVRIAQKSIDIFGKNQVVCSGWSPSGVYHYGNSKEAITCNAFHKELLELDIKSEFIFVVDDMDPLNKIPHELKAFTKELRSYIGHPLRHIPDFTKTTSSYAEYFAQGAIEAFEKFNFEVKIVYASNLYKEGRYDEALFEYMEKEEKLQSLIESITGSRLASMINIMCEKCNSIAAPIITKQEGDIFHYHCVSERQFRGCDYRGTTSIDDHRWKLRWRLDWPARQRFLGVTIEPSGKDHSVQGGSVDTALAIHKNIFERTEPLLERFGFITIKGQKISGSKGNALQARHISDIMPFSAYLFLNYRSDLLKDINFNPSSAEFANLIDEFDRGRKAAMDLEVAGTMQEIRKLRVAAELSMNNKEKLTPPGYFKYSELILLYQITLRNKEKTIEKLRDKIMHEETVDEIRERLETVDRWLDTYAPDSMKYNFNNTNPEGLEEYWNQVVKEVWVKTLSLFGDDFEDTQFTTKLREIAKSLELTPSEIYPPFYQMLLNADRGPNASNLIQVFGRKIILERIEMISV